VEPFGRGRSSPEELRRLTHDHQLGLESAILRRAARNSDDSLVEPPGDLTPVDPILSDPLRQRHPVNAKVGGGLSLFLAGPNQRDSTRFELGGISAGHDDQRFEEAVASHQNWLVG
jgi:hypothetical protein